jgi:ActR/RegA family two-component response regulator
VHQVTDGIGAVSYKRATIMEGVMNVGDLISIDELEREHVSQVIAKTTNLGEAARVLGIDPATLYRKRKRWQMDKKGNADGLSSADGEQPEQVEEHHPVS